MCKFVNVRMWTKLRKFLLVPVIFAFLFITNDSKANQVVGVPLSESSLLNDLHLRSSHLLKDIIILPKEPFNEVEAKKMIERLDRLPPAILDETRKQGIQILFFNGRLTDQLSAAHLQGKVPRGYSADITWDDLPGVGGSKLAHVRIGASEQGKGHGSINLELHELAHSLKRYVFNGDDLNATFTRVWEEEAEVLFMNRRYFLDYEEEYFAETFALYFYSTKSRNELKKLAPKTYEFFSQL